MESILGHTRRPDFTVTRTRNNWSIDISARVASQLAMAEGDVIDVAIARGECMLYIKHKAADIQGEHVATVHPTNKGTAGHFRAYSKRLAKAIFDMTGDENAHKLRFACATPTKKDGRVVVPIITRNPL